MKPLTFPITNPRIIPKIKHITPTRTHQFLVPSRKCTILSYFFFTACLNFFASLCENMRSRSSILRIASSYSILYFIFQSYIRLVQLSILTLSIAPLFLPKNTLLFHLFFADEFFASNTTSAPGNFFHRVSRKFFRRSLLKYFIISYATNKIAVSCGLLIWSSQPKSNIGDSILTSLDLVSMYFLLSSIRSGRSTLYHFILPLSTLANMVSSSQPTFTMIPSAYRSIKFLTRSSIATSLSMITVLS